MSEGGERSAFPCPHCGAHRLAMITFPEQRALGFAPAFEAVGMGDPLVVTPPAIGCLACGAEWPSADAVRGELAARG